MFYDCDAYGFWHGLLAYSTKEDSPRLMVGLEIFAKVREHGIIQKIVGFAW